MRLKINVNKTKYMAMTRKEIVKDNLCTEGLAFEQVDDFEYLGVNINEKNNMHNEIRRRLIAANMQVLLLNEKKCFPPSYCLDI